MEVSHPVYCFVCLQTGMRNQVDNQIGLVGGAWAHFRSGGDWSGLQQDRACADVLLKAFAEHALPRLVAPKVRNLFVGSAAWRGSEGYDDSKFLSGAVLFFNEFGI